MDILLDYPQYGIVPSGRYMYRTRNALDSALNVSKHRKEWYIDSLKYYTFWALDESERRLGYIPDFVQYTIMYDLLARFRMKKFPDGVMTSHEKESFLSMLFRALQRIDDHIVMEQHNLSPELCDYLLSIKKAPDSGTFVYDADAEDQYFHYSDLDSRSSGSFPVNLEALDFAENELTIHGFFKVYTRFPTPSKLFLRLTSEKGTQTLDCNLEEDLSKGAAFNEHQLSVTEYFTASIPYKLLKTKTTVELCMLSGDHVIRFHKLKRKPEFPITKKEKIFHLGQKSYYLSLSPQAFSFKPETPVTYLKRQTKRCINAVRCRL